jgi:mono/diheme cytochrome c family protein
MRAEMKSKSLAWPRIGRSEIADMAAYLRTRHASAPKQVSAIGLQPSAFSYQLSAALVWLKADR